MQRDPERLSRAFDVVVTIISRPTRRRRCIQESCSGHRVGGVSRPWIPPSRFAPHPKFL